MGAEFRRKGVTVALAPVVGPVGRIATGGRNWEAFSVDPYLCGTLIYGTVDGIQSAGVITSTKHFIANEQELYRLPRPLRETNETRESSSSNIDDKTMHEVYLWPFQDAIHAGSGAVMCSYQRINNSYGCQNSKAQNGLLKTELGFEGFIVSDWGAQRSGVGSAIAGMDMVMPSGATYWAGNLTEAVLNGSLSEDRLTDMATRIIASWYYVGADAPDLPAVGIGMARLPNESHPIVDAVDHSQTARDVLLQGAIESHVLVKNTGILPLTEPKLLNLYGYSATAANTNNPSAGIGTWSFGASSSSIDAMLCGFGIPGQCPEMLAIAPNGTIISGGGSGAVTPTYISAPHDALVSYAMNNGIALFWDYDNINATSSVYGTNTACLVFINAWSTEGTDRPNLADAYSDTLVNNIADQCANTIVVIHNAGIRLVDAFYDHPNVTAIIYAHLPGQDSGTALTQILFGHVSPSGKLPYTVARRASDYGDVLYHYDVSDDAEDNLFPQDNFAEGSLLDYKYFDALSITPRFEFGFGLSYTSFSYSNLQITTTTTTSAPISAGCASGPIQMGGRIDLWDPLVRITADITNTGTVAAAEAAQLYLTIPNMELNIPTQQAVVGRQLRGFAKLMLQPGETGMAVFELTRRDVSTWDVNVQEWCVGAGQYVVNVGGSSRNLVLGGTFDV